LGSDERNSLESGTDRAVQRPAALRESVLNPCPRIKSFPREMKKNPAQFFDTDFTELHRLNP